MKILIATTYIYDPAMPEFTKNKTGFGMMVRDIFSAVSETNEVYLISNVLTQGHGKYIMKHTLADVIKYSRPKDWILGIKWFFQYKQGIRSRIQYLYYGLNRGYVRKILRELNPDLVHIHGLSQASKMCMEACDEMKIPYVVTLHGLIGLDETVHAPAWEKEYEKEFLCIAEERNIPVTVISTGMKKRIEKKYLGHEVHNITVITNGTKISSNTVEVNKLTNIKEQFSVQGEYKIALTIGSICERKNQMQILDAMEQLKADERLNFVVFFCGVDATNSTFQHKIEEKNLQDNAIMLGFVERECLDQLMEQADLNIVASKDEGFGLSIIEAYSHGLPTVTFADLDAVENLYDEQAMVVADERSTEALADAIYQAVERRWDRSYIRRVSSNYSLEKMADEYEQKYRAILNGGVIRLALTYDYIRLQKILGKRILVYIGNISENKNQIQAVRVMKQVENAVLFVVGTEADGGVVRNYVQENDLYGRVVLTGFSDDVAQIWENVDLNLFFSKNDGFGLSVIEGYMYGVPSVMFADLDAAEDVYYPHLMLLVNDRSDDSAANAIRQGMSKEWDKDIIKTYAKRFSMRNIARTYDDFYRKSIVAEKL